jgi:hypothetical protein
VNFVTIWWRMKITKLMAMILIGVQWVFVGLYVGGSLIVYNHPNRYYMTPSEVRRDAIFSCSFELISNFVDLVLARIAIRETTDRRRVPISLVIGIWIRHPVSPTFPMVSGIDLSRS